MSSELLGTLGAALLDYDGDLAEKTAQELVATGINPLEVLNTMVTAIRTVGDRFGDGEIFLPELMGAAAAMKRAMPCVEDEIRKRGLEIESPGTVLIGTVLGDQHDIGKSMVVTMLRARNFTVHDLGVDVVAERFVEGVRMYSPDIVAMSALLTTTAPEMRQVIQSLSVAGLRGRLKIIVGGAAVTEEFALSIGADGYAPTATEGANLVESLLAGQV